MESKSENEIVYVIAKILEFFKKHFKLFIVCSVLLIIVSGVYQKLVSQDYYESYVIVQSTNSEYDNKICLEILKNLEQSISLKNETNTKSVLGLTEKENNSLIQITSSYDQQNKFIKILIKLNSVDNTNKIKDKIINYINKSNYIINTTKTQNIKIDTSLTFYQKNLNDILIKIENSLNKDEITTLYEIYYKYKDQQLDLKQEKRTLEGMIISDYNEPILIKKINPALLYLISIFGAIVITIFIGFIIDVNNLIKEKN